MLRKFMSVFLAFVMGCLSIPIVNCETGVPYLEDNDCSIIMSEEDGNVVAKTEVEGSIISCEYVNDTGEYHLYRDDTEYQISVEVINDCTLIDIKDIQEDVSLKEGSVKGQSATVTAIEYTLFTAAAVYASKAVICAVMEVTQTSSTYFSVDSIFKVISDVKTGALSPSKVNTTVGVTSYWALKFSGKRTENNYYYAVLSNGKVYIGPEVSFGLAKRRLCSGRDIFASNAAAAKFLADYASPVRYSDYHSAHVTGEGYYPHFHPIGIPWYKNAKHNPHVWYPGSN